MNINLSEREIRNSILSAFEKKKLWYRKELINECLVGAGVSADILRDKNYESDAVLLKNKVGSVISKMIDAGDLALDVVKQLSVARDLGVVLREDAIRGFVIDRVSAAPIAKKKLFVEAERHFGTDKTPDRRDDNELRSAVGNVLIKLASENVVETSEDGLIVLASAEGDSTTAPVRDLVGVVGDDATTYRRFIRAINLRGGEFFEYFSVRLLRSYFESRGDEVQKSEVTGGSDDGGIDGIVETVDRLGYREVIYLQAKNRRKIHVTLKEVRGFYGALCAYGGSRGIFITTSVFHRDAEKFIKGIDNLIGIDGKKLYEISKKCAFGLISEGEGLWSLDPELFTA